MKLPWFNSLLTFRKSDNSGLIVPQLDNDGRIQVNAINYEPIHVGPTAPAITDGKVAWNNTTSGKEGLYYRDQLRNKWLAQAGFLIFGEDNTDGTNLAPPGITNAGNGTGIRLIRDATIVGISTKYRNGAAVKAYELVKDGTVIFSTTAPATGSQSQTVNIDVDAGESLLPRTVSAGSNIRDCTFVIELRWRA